MLFRYSLGCLSAFCGLMGVAYAQPAFDVPGNAIVTDEGHIDAVRFLNDGDMLLSFLDLDPADFNPGSCSRTDDGFSVRSGVSTSSFNTTVTDVFLAGRGVRLVISADNGCDDVGRPIAHGIETGIGVLPPL